MRILVTGGRDYSDHEKVKAVLDRAVAKFGAANVVLAQGGARGADNIAYWWAVHAGVEVITYPADWKRYGRAAGMIRNQQMLYVFKPDIVVAFPGGRGTAGMVRIAREANVRVYVVEA